MGIPGHLSYLLRNLYAGQEATFRTGHGTTYWFKIRKGVHQGCWPVTVSSLYYSTLRVESLLMLSLGRLLTIPDLVVCIFRDYVINPLETIPAV